MNYANTSAGQTWNADSYAQNAHFVPALGQPVLDLMEVRGGQHILDLGCGNGVLTEKIVEMGATVVGVDSSQDMVDAAKRRGIDARLMSAYELNFNQEFDGAFCNAALHWLKDDPDTVISGVNRALKAGGQFVAEMGGHGNVAAITVALIATLERRGIEDPPLAIPWYFPTVDEYRARLERGGFDVEYIELIPRPTPLATGMAAWIRIFGMTFISKLPVAEHDSAIQETVERLRPVLCDQQERWTADYVRLRFRARAR